jgi:hypothetical protein
MRHWKAYHPGSSQTVAIAAQDEQHHLTTWIIVANSSPSGTDGAGGRSATGEQHRWERARTLVSGAVEGPQRRALECALSLSGSSFFDRWVLAQPTRTAVYGPVRTVVWQGSAGDRCPYAHQL